MRLHHSVKLLVYISLQASASLLLCFRRHHNTRTRSHVTNGLACVPLRRLIRDGKPPDGGAILRDARDVCVHVKVEAALLHDQPIYGMVSYAERIPIAPPRQAGLHKTPQRREVDAVARECESNESITLDFVVESKETEHCASLDGVWLDGSKVDVVVRLCWLARVALDSHKLERPPRSVWRRCPRHLHMTAAELGGMLAGRAAHEICARIQKPLVVFDHVRRSSAR
mmetsp:Transcript_64379/g.192287  ORF Transcript_64379/g.192287 Transcript_64379/m.192287 type:complete len:227 (-) Transcript_64379:447-1127(-)